MTATQVTRAQVQEFAAQKALALVGASRNGRGFGNIVRRELKKRGYKVLTVHPEVEAIDGEPCCRSLAALPEPVGGAIVVVPPTRSADVIREAAAAGIRRIWLQQGAESEEAVRVAAELGVSVVSERCILMFADNPGFPHNVHRGILGLFGRLPK